MIEEFDVIQQTELVPGTTATWRVKTTTKAALDLRNVDAVKEHLVFNAPSPLGCIAFISGVEFHLNVDYQYFLGRWMKAKP